MLVGVRVRVQIVREGHITESLAPDLVISARNFFWGDAFVDSLQHRWRAVHVGSGDHCYFVADDSVEPGEDVGWNVHSCDVAEMRFAVYIRPGDSDEDFSGQGEVPGFWLEVAKTAFEVRADDDFVLKFIIPRARLDSVEVLMISECLIVANGESIYAVLG